MKIENMEYLPLTEVLETIVDNRGKTVPTSDTGIKLIATNCILNNRLFPIYERIRYVSKETYNTWFRSHLKPGDIIFVNKGGPGKVCMVPDNLDFCIAQDMVGLRVKKDIIYNKFLFAYLRTPDVQNFIKSNIVGSLIPHFKKEQFKTIMIPILPMKDQIKIGNLYYNICFKEELNNKINNNLHELEKNLYKEYFKNLDDTNTQKLGDLCKIKYGKGLPTTKIETEGYSVYGGNGIIGYYHEFMYEESQVLISCRGAASGNVIVSKPHSFVTNNSLILECDRKYHHYLKQYSLDNYYYEYTTGSAQPQITIDNIKDIALNIPSEELLDKFNKQMEPLENKYFSNLEEISKLEQLRDTLLPKLMNGEIDLDNIEI